MNFAPTLPSCGGPDSISHEEGASTDVMGMEVLSRKEITEVKGSRGGPLKEKPIEDGRQ